MTSVSKKLKVAYGSVPKESGTYTFYRNHRRSFLNLGVDLRCVSIGYDQAELWDSRFEDEGCVRLAPQITDLKKQAMAFSDWCDKEQVDIVIGINSAGILCSLPHLQNHVRVVARCANGFAKGYEVTLAGRERLAKIVALTPKLRNDLITQYDVSPDRIVLIPNGVDAERFPLEKAKSQFQSNPIQLGFLGRLEHKQKGVLHLPKIVSFLNEMKIDFCLRIAGTGVHESELRESLSSEVEKGKVKFVGMITPDEVPEFLHSTDIFLFTSHFEGCPNALLEAMMAGCGIVSWNIKGITDFVLGEGAFGRLIDEHNHLDFAKAIFELASDRSSLHDLATRARENAKREFSLQKCAEKYLDVFNSSMSPEFENFAPVPWEQFSVLPAFRSKYSWVPTHLKNLFKRFAGGFRASNA